MIVTGKFVSQHEFGPAECTLGNRHTRTRHSLGSQEFTEKFVKRDLLDVAEGVLSKLIDLEDTQAAIFLLRLSFGIVRRIL